MPVLRLLAQCLTTSTQRDILELATMEALYLSIKFKQSAKREPLMLSILIITNGELTFNLSQGHLPTLQFILVCCNLMTESCHWIFLMEAT